MKVLSLLQPWATLVILGVKTIETRNWTTPYRGTLLIHASSGKKGGLIAKEPPFKRYIPDFNSLPFGAIIGSVLLEAIVPVELLFMPGDKINQLSLEERAFGDYTPGRYAWLFNDATAFEETIPYKGALRLWDYPL
jgi:hypothetical protein